MKRAVPFVMALTLAGALLVRISLPIRQILPQDRPASEPKIIEAYGRLPLSFEANQGQTDSSVRFLSRGNGYTLFLTANEAVLTLKKSEDRSQKSEEKQILPLRYAQGQNDSNGLGMTAQGTGGKGKNSVGDGAVLRMKLVGANPNAEVSGLDELPGKSNYFIGNDPAKWRTNVPTYAKVRYENVYSGIDLVYYGNQQQLEYDFVVAPGADPGAIRLAFPSVGSHGTSFVPWVLGRNEPERAHGIKSMPWLPQLRIDGQGDLVLEAEGSELRLHRPVIYQEISGSRQRVGGNFVIHGKPGQVQGGRQVGFEVARYDASKPLIIDPVLSYSTYLGGNERDIGRSIATDASGNTYVFGETSSANFPTMNPFQAGLAGGSAVFVTKLGTTGKVVYSTYLGGAGSSIGIAVDPVGNAYVAGASPAENFPITRGALQTSPASYFVTKLGTAGNLLLYSTYFRASRVTGIALDPFGNAYLTGQADPAFPSTQGAFQTASGGNDDCFVAKLNSAGSALIFSTYLGGSGGETCVGIAVDSVGNAYVTGQSSSRNFPVTPGAFRPFSGDAPFVAKLNSAGSALGYSTFLDGGQVRAIAVDASGNAYLAGYNCTESITTPGVFQKSPAGGFEIFVTRLNAVGTALLYTTCLGSNGDDQISAVAVDFSGNAYVTGETNSISFPTTTGAVQTAYGGGFRDAFVSGIDPTGTALIYSTFLGGKDDEFSQGIAVDPFGNVYVTGWTTSPSFPTTPGAFQNALQSIQKGDAFVTKFPADTVSALPPPQVPQGSVVNNASFALHPAPIAPGTIIAIFGSNLTKDNVIVDDTTLGPDGKIVTTLGGASVKINGIAAPMLRAYPTQLVVQMPVELTNVTSAQVTVSVDGQSQSSTPQTFFVAALSPGIFFVGAGQGAILNGVELNQGIKSVAAAVGSFPDARPARPGETVVIFCTGLGRVNDPVPTGVLPSGLHPTVEPTTVIIDGLPVVPDYAGLAPGNAGLYQVNVRIPNGTRVGNNIAVALNIGGATSNTVTIAVQESLEATLVAPSTVTVNLMPPLPPTVPVSVPVTVSLTNRGTTPQTLTAATPCDVHTWTFTDLTDNVIQSEPPEICIQVIASRTIAPGETITEDATVVLDGRLLRDRTSYKLKYRFWGVPSEAKLDVQVVQ